MDVSQGHWHVRYHELEGIMRTHRAVTQNSPASGDKPAPVPVRTMPLEKAKKLIRKDLLRAF